jgi:hypothetical protein
MKKIALPGTVRPRWLFMARGDPSIPSVSSTPTCRPISRCSSLSKLDRALDACWKARDLVVRSRGRTLLEYRTIFPPGVMTAP